MAWKPEYAERQKQQRRKKHDSTGGRRCRFCGLATVNCQDLTKSCSACGQTIAACVEQQHQRGLYCRAATVARSLEARGLVRAPSDAVVSMASDAGIAHEWHPTTTDGDGSVGRLRIRNEPWVPRQVVEIIEADRPLGDRLRALQNLAAWLSTKSQL